MIVGPEGLIEKFPGSRAGAQGEDVVTVVLDSMLHAALYYYGSGSQASCEREEGCAVRAQERGTSAFSTTQTLFESCLKMVCL